MEWNGVIPASTLHLYARSKRDGERCCLYTFWSVCNTLLNICMLSVCECVLCFFCNVYLCWSFWNSQKSSKCEPKKYRISKVHTHSHCTERKCQKWKGKQRETFVEILLEQAKGSAKKYKKKNNRQVDQKCQGCDEAVKDRLYRLLLLLILFVVSKQQQQRWRRRSRIGKRLFVTK